MTGSDVPSGGQNPENTPPQELLEKPAGAEELAAQDREKGATQKAENERAADALLNPPLPEGKPGDTMGAAEQRLNGLQGASVSVPEVPAGVGAPVVPLVSDAPTQEDVHEESLVTPEELGSEKTPAESANPEEAATESGDEVTQEQPATETTVSSEPTGPQPLSVTPEEIPGAQDEEGENKPETPAAQEQPEVSMEVHVADQGSASDAVPGQVSGEVQPVHTENVQGEQLPNAEQQANSGESGPTQKAPTSEVASASSREPEASPEQNGAGLAPPAEESPAQATVNEEESARQAAAAVLAQDKEYQQAQQELNGDNMARFREIEGKSQEEKDRDVNEMSGKERKAYNQYVELRERVRATEQDAAFAERERRINAREAEIANLPENKQQEARDKVAKERRALEAERRQEAKRSLLERDSEYQGLQRKYRGLEKRLREHYGGNDAADGKIRALAGRKWRQLTPEEQSVFGDEEQFNKYSLERGVMNGKEIKAEDSVFLDRLEKNYDTDGTVIPEEKRQARRQQLLQESQQKKHDWSPGAVRRGFRKLNLWIGRRFGKTEMNEHGEQALGYARRLVEKYGIRGLFFGGTEEAKNLRKLMRHESWEYLKIAGPRKLGQALLLMGFMWLVYPIMLGKTIELTKPFGGNG
ncbi:MAG TPA: hypothetical protein VLB73_04530 [Patescibacteria group bacterium]|nr:hypothetical protein [Patescibacteria group bacterium]